MSASILIVEDEPAQVEVLRYNLEQSGFEVEVAGDGATALAAVGENLPDLIVLDWMLPEISGIEVCRRLRARDETRTLPVIMLTARGEEDDRVRGLEIGADDYVVKPYSPAEMVARVRALLRRADPAQLSETLEYADISMDLAAHKVHRDGVPLKLGPTEFKLLRVFMERPGRVLSRERLLDLVWGSGVYVEDRTVDAHVGRLRKALNAGGKTDLLRTVRGVGYALDASA